LDRWGDVLARRFARLYSDGSFGVDDGSADLDTARKRLGMSQDDGDTELVEVEIKVVETHGTPKLKVVKERCITCPTCSEEIFFDDAIPPAYK
jgi:hypothetical protein